MSSSTSAFGQSNESLETTDLGILLISSCWRKVVPTVGSPLVARCFFARGMWSV